MVCKWCRRTEAEHLWSDRLLVAVCSDLTWTGATVNFEADDSPTGKLLAAALELGEWADKVADIEKNDGSLTEYGFEMLFEEEYKPWRDSLLPALYERFKERDVSEEPPTGEHTPRCVAMNDGDRFICLCPPTEESVTLKLIEVVTGQGVTVDQVKEALTLHRLVREGWEFRFLWGMWAAMNHKTEESTTGHPTLSEAIKAAERAAS